MPDDPPTLDYATPPAPPRAPLYAVVFNVAAAVFLFAMGGLVGAASVVGVIFESRRGRAAELAWACLLVPVSLVFLGGGYLAAQEAGRLIRLRRDAPR